MGNDAPSQSDAVYLSGVVRVRGENREDVVAGWCELDAGEDEPQRANRNGSFTLETTDGHRITIEALEHDLTKRVVPARTERGEWSELESTPMARLVEAFAPGPMVRVKLRGAVLRDGDRVFVIGRTTEASFDEQQAGGPRSAATPHPSIVKPEVIGVGPDAESNARRTHLEFYPRPKAPKPARDPETTARVPLASVLWLVAAAISVVMLVPLSDSITAPLMPGAALFAIANAIWWRPSHLDTPRFVSTRTTRVVGSTGVHRVYSFVVTVAAVFACAMTQVWRGSPRPSEQQLGVMLSSAIFPVACFLLAAIGWLAGRRDARATRALLATPSSDKGSTGATWTVVTGNVSDTTPVHAIDGTPSAMTRRAESDEQWKHDTQWTFSIALADGTDVEIDPNGATWATTVLARRQHRDKEGNVTWTEQQEIVPVGAMALVAGRLDRAEKRMRATGPDSLIVFASPSERDPRAVLGAARRARTETLALIGLTGLCAAGLTVAVATRTRMPVLNPEPVPSVVRYARSEIPATSFEDVCSRPDHVSVSPSVDDRTVVLPVLSLPFELRYYGAVAQPPFSASTNGWMSLSPTTESGLSGHLPSTSRPNAVLAPYWTDLETRTSGICSAVVGAAPHRRWIVQWDDVYDCCSNDPRMHLTFEVVIHEAPARANNVIDFVYARMDGSRRAAVIGLEDANGLEGNSIAGPFSGPRGIRWEPE